MAHLQYMPGDPRLVDQLVYELKSKGIFDQFRKDCIADVDTRPAYQNLRQRVENSVTTFLSRQTWQPDMNKNQLREKLRKHILDGNYLEQGVERIVDQVVNPKVASVFIPKVEDLVYKVLGITRKKSPSAETSNEKVDLLPTDLEAVSPGSVRSNDDKNEAMDVDVIEADKMDIDEEKSKLDAKEESIISATEKENTRDIQLPTNTQNEVLDKNDIPLPTEEIKPENIPSPDAHSLKAELEKIELPKEIVASTDIPLPSDTCKEEKDQYFKPVISEDDDSSSDSSLRRNMSPLTPIRNFNNENSCDAQQAFENDLTDNKSEDKKEPSSFRFKIDAKSTENSSDAVKTEKKEAETNLSYQFNSQVNINNFNTPLYEDSSNSNNLHIDYESDANSKVNTEVKVAENDHNSEDSKKEKKPEEKKSSHKSSHRSRDSHKYSSSKDKRSDSKHSYSRDSSRHDKSKSSKDDNKSKSSDKEKSKDKNEKKDSSRESSRHRSSHKSSHKDTKSHRSSSSSRRHSSKHTDEKKSSSSTSHRDKDKSLDKSSSEKSKDLKSSSHRSDKDRKGSSSSKSDKNSSKSKDDKEKDKKNKKENDDHYSLSGRGNPNRRSTDRDSNDGSSSSKGSHNPSNSKSSNSKKDSKSSSKSESTSTSGESTSPSDKENIVQDHSSKTREALQHKPIVRIESQLEMAHASPPRLPFVPDVTIRKPKFAANLEEAKRLMKMRKFLDDEQKRMNQEAALLLEFQANVRPSMSQVYSSIPGPELEFACVSNLRHSQEMVVQSNDNTNQVLSEENYIDVFNHEHDNINNVLTEEHNNVNTVTQELDSSVLTIEKAHYTNNELLIVLNDTKDDEVNDAMDYEMQFDNVNKTNITTIDFVQESIKIQEENQTIDIKSETLNEVSEIIESNSGQNAENISTVPGIVEYIETTKESYIIEKVVKNEPTEIIEQTESKETKNNEILTKEIEEPQKQDSNKTDLDLNKVTISLDESSESEETTNESTHTVTQTVVNSDTNDIMTQNKKSVETIENQNEEKSKINGEFKLHYFGEHEKYNAELERAQFNNFFKEYTTRVALSNKLYLINCDTYEENIVREVSKELGEFEIVSYHKNGHLKLPKNKNVIKNVNISTEISLPLEADYENTYYYENEQHNIFSPEKPECSFELSSDYNSKLEEMVNKTSRQEVMEIILGNVIDASPSKMPQIDYFTESNIDSDYENSLKRKISEISEETTTSVNNNRLVLTPNKIRKLSTDQISSTTHENEETPSNKNQSIARSKYLGKARRVGLPRPKRTTLPNSPSSDKSVENYEQNTPATPTTPNGKLRRKVQRYDTSDLYKPKLHYLSRRNHVT